MAYTPTEWYVQAPITQESMNKIEKGIKDAHDGLDTVQSDIRDASTRMNGLDTRIGTNADDITTLRTQFSGMTTNAEDGRKAWAQVSGAITMNGDVVTQSLNDRIGAVEGTLGNHSTEIEAARKGKTNIRAKIDDIDKNISDLGGSVTTIEEKFASAKGTYPTVEDRFTAAEERLDNLDATQTGRVPVIEAEIITARGVNGTSLDGRFSKIELQLDNAKESSAKDKSFESVDARFEELENEVVGARGSSVSVDARLDKIDDMNNENSQIRAIIATQGRVTTLEGLAGDQGLAIATLQGEVVRKVDIVNDANTVAAQENKVLDARMGKTLQDQITTLQQNASTEGDRIDALEAELDMASADGSRRIDLVEADVSAHDTELTDAHDSTANDTTYGSIDARFEANETKANTLETNLGTVTTLANQLHTDVQTIANELSMVDHGAIVDTNTRIDTLEDTVSSLQSTMGDQADFGDRITAAENDIDDLQDAVGSLQTTVSGNGGLTERMAAAETNITNAANAASAAQTTANGAAAAVANAASQSSLNTLADRVTTLEGKDTVIVSDATFDAETGMPQIQNPSSNCDYLILGSDNKYYYWRYLGQETGWQMISGGGGGAGNSSGYDFETMEDYAALEEHAENTDYYVQSADGVHHYRWVPYTDLDTGETSLVEIEIGCVTNTENIKKYNVALETVTNENDGTSVHYLNLYEFDASDDNSIDENDEENEITRLEDKRIRHILLPATGGGGTVASMKFTSITPRVFSSAINGDQPIELKFFFTTGEANDGAYYDLYIGRIVNNAVVDEKKVLSQQPLTSGDPSDKSTTWPSTTPIPQGFYSINVSQYFNQVGYYQIRLTAKHADNTSITGGITWQLHTINFYLTSDSEDGLIVNLHEPVTLGYTPFGAIDKTLHVVIDGGTEDAIEMTKALSERTSGRADTITIDGDTLAHGLHKIDMYMTAVINNITVPTKHIYREYIWYDPEDEEASELIVSSRYNNQTIAIDAYTDFSIPYSIYYKGTEDYLIEYYLNYGTASEQNLGQIQSHGNVVSHFDYIPITSDNQVETQVITIKVNDQMAVITLTVSPIEQDVSPISGAVIDFDPSTLTNSSLNREPEWKTPTNVYNNWDEWVAGLTYNVGANVIYDGYAYTCRTANRDNEWTPSHWAEQGAYKYYLKASENFNWSSDASGGGYREDEDGKCFVIKAGSYVDINYRMFKNNGGQSAIYDTGTEMKIIFKTMAVRTADAIWFTNAKAVNDKPIGIQLSAHSGWLKTDKASDGAVTAQDNYDDWVAGTSYGVGAIVVYDRANDGTIYKCKTANADEEFDDGNWLKIGKAETKVDATNTYLYFPYSEGDKIELDIDINRYIQGQNNNFIMSYEDGVPSKALPYTYGPGGDGLYHPNGEEATIRIGSPDCDVYIYRFRIYNKSLGTDEILQNFIADGKTVKEKVERYERNCIYWDEEQGKFFTTPSQTAKLDPIKLAEKMPNVKVLMLECPTFTLNKSSYIKDSSLRCLQIQTDANGNFVYPEEGNWFFQKGYHAGQGTTSDNYGQAGRNIDFLFECDGTNYPAKSKNVKDYPTDGSYVSNLLRGNDTSKWVVVGHNTATDTDIYGWQAVDGAEPEECTDWKGDDCKIQLTSTSVPNNYFNLKVNIASSENVNNALFQKRYSEFINAVNPSPATAVQEAKHQYSQDEHFSGPVVVKNTMEFVPAVLFLRETAVDDQGNPKNHVEFNDCDWHFYALGNIGDSKKTDYTRAYDPDDMNEFTLEISDNNTKNSQFQSGLYKVNGVDTVEQADSSTNSMNYLWGLTDAQWNATRSPNADELSIRAQINAGAEGLIDVIMGGELEDGSDGEVYVNYRHRMLVSEPFDGKHSFEFRYACQGDYRDGDLINPVAKNDPRYKLDKAQEKLNRKVFEAFYSWLVTANETQYRDEAPLWFVPGAMEFFYAYTHYYTMMDNRAKNTFWHFAHTGIRRAVPIGRAVKALMHIYEEDDGNGGYQPATGDFDNTKQYYTSYAFDLWVYDCDTAAGIDNNGALVFPYGKEDSDYRTEGDALSGMAFNGAGSIFWRRLKNTFTNDIRTIMTQTPVNCFNSQNLIDEFDATQECYPEEVWRLDIERKYIRTFTGVNAQLPYDNAVAEGKQNPRFLRSMMQGRKKYQRRQWIRDQGVYFNSKYRLDDITKDDNTNEFSATTPAVPEWQARTQYYINDYVRTKVEPFDELKPKFKIWRCIEANNDATFTAANWQASVTPEYMLTLTPYQDMYLNVQVGNGNYQASYITNDGTTTLRAKAGRTYTFDISGSYQETRIYINGANHLSGIGGLAPMYPYSFDLRALQHIKVLDIGTDDPTYTNTKFTTLDLDVAKPLLETLNVKNCRSLGGALNLTNASNIRTVEATGTLITTVNLPQYTNIETLHLPITATDISLYAARKLTDFTITDSNGNIDYTRITKLEIVDSDYSDNIDWIDIALGMIDNSETVKLLELKQASIGNLEELEPFRMRKQLIEVGAEAIVLSGNITVNGEWSEIEKNNYERIWNELHLLVIDDAEHKKVKHKLTYNYEIDGLQHEYSIYVNNNAEIQDIVVEGIIDTPTKSPTAEYTYTFGTKRGNAYQEYTGWRIVGDSMTLYERYRQDGYLPRITQETFVEPVFTATLRRYDINWFLNSTDTQPIKTESQVLYGGGDSAEAPTVEYIHQQNRDTRNILFERASNPVMVRYNIFNGWNNLPIKINPTVDQTSFDIYGVWINGYQDLPSIMTDPNTDPIVWLYVYANMTEAERKLYADVGKKITLETGYKGPSDDVKYKGTLLIGDGANYTMTLDNGRTATYPSTARFHDDITDRPFTTQIQPLKLDNDEFTIAIDYAFDADGIRTQQDNYSGSEMVLASCYDRTNGAVAGFKLVHYIDDAGTLSGPRLAFGDTSVSGGYGNQSISLGTTDSASLRNTIVLQHPKGSSILYIYSGINGGSDDSVKGSILTDMSLNSAIQSIEWNNVNTNAYLVFGDIAIGSTSSQSRKGKGVVYWAKYWNYDLGVGECRRIAGWSHEKMTYAIEEYAGMDTKYGGRFVFPSGNMPNVVLTSLTAPSYGNVLVKAEKSGNVTAGTSIQWPGSILQTVANKRIYQSLPIALQSIITKSPVRSRQSVYTPSGFGTGGNYQVGNTEVVVSNDYVFIPSSVEMGNTNTTYRPHEAIKNMIWYNAGNTIVHKWNTTSRVWQNDTSNAIYMNLRFPEIAISTDENDIYYNFAATELYPTVYDAIGPSTIKRGDILIYLDVAYIYVLEEDVTNGAITCENIDAILDCYGNGGWVQSKMYYLRSPYDNNQTTGAFMCINSNGSLQATAAPPATTGYGLSYSFSI